MTLGKRTFDLVGSLGGLLVLWPLLAAISLLIKLGDRGPVFFRQERVGRRGSKFFMWKFRTMVVDAEKRGKQLTIGTDPRITPLGRWLRKFKLDELPQLFNVVGGEMSLVGPRPEVPRYTALYDEQQRRVLDLVPGITDPASIRFHKENAALAAAADPERTYIDEIMPEKIRLNLAYAEHATVLSDLGVILKTLVRIIT